MLDPDEINSYSLNQASNNVFEYPLITYVPFSQQKPALLLATSCLNAVVFLGPANKNTADSRSAS